MKNKYIGPDWADVAKEKDEEIRHLKHENTFLQNEQQSYIDLRHMFKNHIADLKKENAELKADIVKFKNIINMDSNTMFKQSEKIEKLKACIAELEQEISVLKLQLETYCDDCDELIR